ncbi:hypothetical protein EON63_05625 [archaeon]|nr:MAG: hypothetical protein EON63_05625 [archaeon]
MYVSMCLCVYVYGIDEYLVKKFPYTNICTYTYKNMHPYTHTHIQSHTQLHTYTRTYSQETMMMKTLVCARS